MKTLQNKKFYALQMRISTQKICGYEKFVTGK